MASPYVFPLELRKSQANWPFMCFSVLAEGGANDIYIPMPQGLTFSDAALYSNLNLGILGNIGQQLAGSINNAYNQSAGVMDTMMNTGGAAIESLKQSTVNAFNKSNAAAAASYIARQGLRMDEVANLIDYGTKQIVAPNTRTAFENTSVRSFGFQFKMVGRDEKDSTAIRGICRTFQEYMYPEGTDVLMKYPPTWKISFYNGEGVKNPHIPGIYDCFLTTFTATYNSSTNLFHTDGSPLEVDVAIGFQETKALTRKEIVELNS